MSDVAHTEGQGTSPELLYLLQNDPGDLAAALAGMRAADVAEALNYLHDRSPDAAGRVLAALPFELAVQVLDEPELEIRYDLFHQLDAKVGARLIEAMSADQQADLWPELPEEERARFLPGLSRETRRGLDLLLAYPPESAGGLMTTEFVALPSSSTVEQALQHVSRVGGAKETVYAIYVLEPNSQRLTHVVSLRELMSANRARRVAEVGDTRKPITVGPLVDREEVGRIISKYNLLAVPVVDGDGHMLGIVTVDDVIDAIMQEQTEDVHKFGGMEALDEPYMEVGFLQMLRKRAGWLMALFVGEMLTASALGRFESEIDRAVILALFIPLIISAGGNSGGQSTSLIIRAMALREVGLRDWWRVALRDMPTSLALGAILGVLAIIRIVLWQQAGWADYGVHYALLAATVGSSVFGVVAFGSLTGSMLPFLIRRLGLDPATASAPFVATLVDLAGIMIYFTIATLLLTGTLL
jgi:magnesium transporter